MAVIPFRKDVVHRARNIVARVSDRCLCGLYGRCRLSSRSSCFNRLLVLRHVIEIAIGDRSSSNLVGCIAKPSVDKFLNNKLGLPEPTLKEHLFPPAAMVMQGRSMRDTSPRSALDFFAFSLVREISMLTYSPHGLANLNPELRLRQMLLELGTSSGVLPRPCPGDCHSECPG